MRRITLPAPLSPSSFLTGPEPSRRPHVLWVALANFFCFLRVFKRAFASVSDAQGAPETAYFEPRSETMLSSVSMPGLCGVSALSAIPATNGSALHRLQLVDHALDHRKPLVPEGRVGGVEAEGGQKLLVVLGVARLEHLEIPVLEALGRGLVGGIERVHEAVAEGVGVDVEGRVDEMRDIGPEGLVALHEIKGGPEAFGLHGHPQFADIFGRELALAACGVQLAFEIVERDLAHHGVDHVLDLAR